jgi:hypothetical protein
VRLNARVSFGALLLGVWPASALVAGTIGKVAATPSSASVGVATAATFTAVITDPSVIPSTVQLQQLDTNGKVVSIAGTMHDDGANGDATAGDGIFTLSLTVYQTEPGPVTFRVAAGFKGALLRTLSAPIIINVTGTGVGIVILSPANLTYTNTSPVSVSGSVDDPNATVKINGVNAPVTAGKFLATVPLVEGVNTLSAVATNTGGTVTTASVQVTLDTTPPHITIDSPANNSTTTASSVTVTGTANDVVVGTVNSGDVQVAVNGIPAQVANRTYSAANVPLAVGPNTIHAVGSDRAGNGTTVTATVTRTLPNNPPKPNIGAAVITNTLTLVSGNNQTAMIGTQLPAPLVVSMTDMQGHPVPSQQIVFAVTGNNGTLLAGGSPGGSVAVNTDANGRAQAVWTLGLRSGAGINTVQVTSALAVGAVNFTATGTTSTAAQINVDSGNNQTGALGQALAFPLVAAVTDLGHNRVPNIPVTFTITQGGGNMAAQPSQTVNTDSSGRAIAVLTLGTQPGNDNNVVQASFPGNSGAPAIFSATAKAPGNPANTSISGVVLDNSNNPIAGVTMRLFLTNQASNNNLPLQIGTPVPTNAKGAFVIPQVPVGFFKLMADGTTAPGPKSYPTLEYDIVTVAGQENTLGMPIYLPALDPVNKLCVDATHGGTLTLPQSPGFALTVLPGSATFPGGSKTGCISVTPVNGDKVPMAPGFGQQPRFIVTIQPVGTTFNPPAPITIPNVDGLKPRAVTEMYSYDHDLAMFVAIGTGTVSTDGSVIVSDPGVGVLKAGWHCGGDPNTSGSTASLAVSLNPKSKVTGVGSQFDITASGTPPLDGKYSWEIIATQPGDDAGAGTLASSPDCAGQPTCTATVKGAKGGKATLRVHFICTTTGKEVTADARITVVKVESVKMTIPHTQNVSPCPGVAEFADDTFQSASDSDDMGTNTPIALPRKTDTLKLECKTTPVNTDPDVLSVLKWIVKRNKSDVEAGAAPAITPAGANATMDTDAQGSFSAFCYVDANGNADVDSDESKIAMNTALVGIKVNSIVATAHPSELKQAALTKTEVTVATGTFSFADTAHAGFYMTSNISLVGGGADRKIGVDDITVLFIQNFLDDTYAGNYTGGKTVKEIFVCDPATPNPICGGTPALMSFPVVDSDVAYPTGGTTPSAACCRKESNVGDSSTRKIEWLDSPAFVSGATHACDATKTLTSTSGANDFITYMVSFGSKSTHSYVAHANAIWTPTVKGAVAKNGDGNLVWTPDASSTITATSSTAGYPQSANNVGILVYGPCSVSAPSLHNDGR